MLDYPYKFTFQFSEIYLDNVDLSFAGYFIPDIVVAASIGLATSWCVGPLLPVVGHWLSRKSILLFLLQCSILAMALSSQLFPYSVDAPKRLIFQHTIRTEGKLA